MKIHFSYRFFFLSGAFKMIRENQREHYVTFIGYICLSSLFVLQTASGRQGMKPLVL